MFQKYAEKCEQDGTSILEYIVQDIKNISIIYREVEEVSRQDIKRFLERRKVMNMGVVTPLGVWLLSADNLSLECRSNCLTALESFLVRRVACGYNARSYGALFVSLIQKLSTVSADEADRVTVLYLSQQKGQATLWPDDEEMLENFITKPLYLHLSRGRLRMILEGIEEKLRPNKAENQEVPSGLQIEHTMPVEWQAHWPLPEDLASTTYH